MFISLSIRHSPLNKKIDIKFNEGINVLKGKNSSGKSTVLEYLNYSLFGSTALRSPISTFDKRFSVECILIINNIKYKIIRNVKDSSLYIDDPDTDSFQILVTGITPVNNYLKSLLTYDYKIFSLTNFCKQHELLKLTSCSPAELVNLIEIVSGLDSSYKLLLSLKESRKESKAVINTLKTSLDTSKVTLTSNFETNDKYENLLKENEDVLVHLQQTVVDKNDTYYSLRSVVSNLESLEDKYIQSLEELKNINTQIDSSIENPDEHLVYLNNINSEISALKSKLSDYKPKEESYTEEFLRKQESLIQENTDYQNYLKLRKQLEDKVIECPKCSNRFIPNSEESLEEDNYTPPEAPIMTIKDIREHREWNSSREEYESSSKHLDELESVKNTLHPKHVLEKQKTLLIEKSFIENTLESIKEDKRDKLQEGFNLGFDLNIQDRDSLLESVYQEYLNFQEEFNNFKDYIESKTQYLKNKGLIESFQSNLNKSISDLKTYNILYDVLQEVKRTIQQESFPIINNLSSDILSQITGGERNKVTLTEDFKIEVDNQPLDTIEGSAKVITNLALRVALLNTFYKDTFLVCMFDEIDESLHEDRFSYMEEAFNNLSNQGYQLILTSHKDFSSDNIINMDNFKND